MNLIWYEKVTGNLGDLREMESADDRFMGCVCAYPLSFNLLID